MSRNDFVNFKVFLRRGDDVEVRRFSIESDAVTNFIFLREKLQSLFPVLREADFKVTWKGWCNCFCFFNRHVNLLHLQQFN